MSSHRIASFRLVALVTLLAALYSPASGQETPHPEELLQQADHLAWNRSWTEAMPLYAEAERLFTARGDHRNALYAEINKLRGELPGLPVLEVSQRLAEYLEDPLLQQDDHLRLRALAIKGDTDVDLDPVLAEQSWREALELAERLGESAWANRAKGELGLVAFLQGDIGASVIRLGQALEVAQTNGDIPSVVRWLTLFGHGYGQLRRHEQALEFYGRALDAASTVPDLGFPLMSYVGRGTSLTSLGRFPEAQQVLEDGLAAARERGAFGHEAELTIVLGRMAHERGDTEQALALLSQAGDLARKAGAGRILAENSLQLARIQRGMSRPTEAVQTLQEGVATARTMQERFLLPRLLAELAELRSEQRRYADAEDLLEEATDVLEGLFANASSPWVQSRLVSGMDEVFAARIRLEGDRDTDAARLFSVIERARGRSLHELLVNRPIADLERPAELRDGERQIAGLQVRLLQATDRADRRRLLDEIFLAEQRLAPATTELFDRSRRGGSRTPVELQDLQDVLRPDEVFLEFVLADPHSYCIVVTRSTARVERLPGGSAISDETQQLLDTLQAGEIPTAEAERLGALLLGPLGELDTRSRVVVSPDGSLHQVPFELLTRASGETLLETHVVSYAPSASVLTVLRDRSERPPHPRTALAVSASRSDDSTPPANVGAIGRSIYDLDGAQLRPLPAANDEARSVVETLGASRSTLLLGETASELALKQQPLSDYQVVHFAVHGIPSTRFPERAALLMHPAGEEDGVLQAREILTLRLAADLVTLSACDTAGGSLHGQDGVLSLVRPFLAAGAGAVVANLWTADDTFSLSLMREFYRQLAAGADIASGLRQAKLHMLELFGPQAVPRLWSGVVLYGDGTTSISSADNVRR